MAPATNGSMWVSDFRGDVLLLSPSGATTPVDITGGWAVTSDPSGDLYVDTYYSGVIYKVTPAGTVTTFASGWVGLYGMAYGPDGDLYVSTGSVIYKIAPGGSYSVFATGAGGDSFAFDSSGNLYSGSNNNIFKIAPNGSSSLFATVAGATFLGLAISPFSHTLFASSANNGDLYSFSAGGAATPVLTTAQLPGSTTVFAGIAFDPFGDLYLCDWGSSNLFKLAGADGTIARPTNLTVTPGLGSLTANWSSTSGAGTFLCTLMYGYNAPSSFHEVVTTTSCAFYGLDPGTVYGISVAATIDSVVVGPSVVAFAQPL
ncbi:MAG TPA: hypothetical protein VGS61_06755, partial [Acidimicrobiales bacterium]|nr:hypothetical protein [Acidimicrobiales bacterium]